MDARIVLVPVIDHALGGNRTIGLIDVLGSLQREPPNAGSHSLRTGTVHGFTTGFGQFPLVSWGVEFGIGPVRCTNSIMPQRRIGSRLEIKAGLSSS